MDYLILLAILLGLVHVGHLTKGGYERIHDQDEHHHPHVAAGTSTAVGQAHKPSTTKQSNKKVSFVEEKYFPEGDRSRKQRQGFWGAVVDTFRCFFKFETFFRKAPTWDNPKYWNQIKMIVDFM